MLKRIDTLEGLIYFWETIASRDKVSDMFLADLAKSEELKEIYDEEFNEKSLQTVLSSISNRERLNATSQKERKFWSNNMWMLDDISFMRALTNPLKQLNLDKVDSKFDEVIFVPGIIEEKLEKGSKLYINFFKLSVSQENENELVINDKPLIKYIEEA